MVLSYTSWKLLCQAGHEPIPLEVKEPQRSIPAIAEKVTEKKVAAVGLVQEKARDAPPSRRTARLNDSQFRQQWYTIVQEVVRGNPTDEELEDIIEYIRRYDAPSDTHENVVGEKCSSILLLAYVGDERVLKHVERIFSKEAIDEFLVDWDGQYEGDSSNIIPLFLMKFMMRANAYFVLALIDSPDSQAILMKEYNGYRESFGKTDLQEPTEMYFYLQDARGLMDACEELGREAVLGKLFSSDRDSFLMEYSMKYEQADVDAGIRLNGRK
jgi:hypothetical protein